MHTDNNTLNITELLARINMKATLIGGPCEGAPVQLPPMLYGQPPEYVCVQRNDDQTSFHYVHTNNTDYVYADHCDTYLPWPHNPWDPELSNKARERRLFAGVGLIICLASAIAVLYAASLIAKVFL